MLSEQTETFASLFQHHERTFEIPVYQRAYSWGEVEINQFLTDLRDVQGSYYLGHYLFEQGKQSDSSHLYVIDGQQRLTTCIIFFSALCKELVARKNTAKETIDTIRDTYLFDPNEGTQKLRTVANDNDFFREEILLQEDARLQVIDTASKKRIRAAYKLIEKVVNDKTVQTSELERWAKLVQEATVTHLIVTSKTRAAQIFAFQNDRGKSLNNLEILKSYFMLQILLSNQSQGSIDDYIRSVERDFTVIYTRLEQVKELGEDEVLAYFWRSTTKDPYSNEPAVAGIKQKIRDCPATERVRWIQNFVKGLAQAFTFVQEIEQEVYEHALELRNLNRMALAYPLLLRAYRDGIDRPTKERLFKFLENITFRHLLRGGRADISSRFRHHFFSKGVQLTNKELNLAIDEFKGMLKRGDDWGWQWNDHTVREQLNFNFYGNNVDNYLLWKYELFISPKDYKRPPSVDYKQLMSNESIEHIAPQTPEYDDEDMHLANYGVYDHNASPSEGIRSGNWLNRLGNLMLMSQSQNSRIGNRSFNKKFGDIQRESVLQQHQKLKDFLAFDSDGNLIVVWDKAAIERRHNHIIEAALEIWNLDNI